MDFICTNPSADNTQDRLWSGRAVLAAQTACMAELILYGRGSRMDVIIGKYQGGLYLCIPDINVGCPLSSMPDTFWNQERLSRQMNPVDAATVAWALRAAAAHWGIFQDSV